MRNKWFISVWLLVPVLICFFVLPVSAEDFDNDVGINVLDYCTVNGTGNNYFNLNGSKEITLDFSGTYAGRRIDMLFHCPAGPAITLVQSRFGTTYNDLTVLALGNNYYRAYGTIRASSYYYLYLTFHNGGTGTTYVNLLSVNLYGYDNTFDTPLWGEFTSNFGHDEYLALDPTVSYPRAMAFSGVTDANDTRFWLYLNCPDWKKYDYIDMELSIQMQSITSISAVMGSTVLDIETNITDNSAFASSYFVTIRLDLTGLDRSSSDYPMVTITGNMVLTTSEVCSVNMLNCSGIILTDAISPLSIHFKDLTVELRGYTTLLNTSLVNGFQAVVDAIGGPEDTDTSASDSLQSQGEQMAAYEAQHQAALQSGIGTLQSAGNISNFGPALAFVGGYTTKVFGALGDYQVIITLPLTIGFILFMMSRVRGSDKPKKHKSNGQGEQSPPPPSSGASKNGDG